MPYLFLERECVCLDNVFLRGKAVYRDGLFFSPERTKGAVDRMNGETHLVAGLATGIGVSYFSQGSGAESVAVTSVATMASLAPDLDTAGSLTHRLTRPFRMVNRIAFMLLLIVFFASYVSNEVSSEMLIGGIGVLLTLLLLKRITIKFQLFIMAMVIGIIGYHYGYYSIVLFAMYVGVASLLPHRSYTHSLIGLVCFSYISYQASIDFGMEPLFLAGFLGYLSHLLLDSRWIPGNRRGIKILLPFRRPII